MKFLNQKNMTIILFTLISSIWLNPAYAFECVLDIDGDGIGDGTAGATSGSNAAEGKLACGNQAGSTGLDTVAIGSMASTNSSDSVAIGSMTTSTRSNTVAIGSNAQTRGLGATAIGYFSMSSGEFTLAIGNRSLAEDDNSLAVGYGAKAEHIGAFAFGNNAKALARNSMAIGNGAFVAADADGSIALGRRVRATKKDTMHVGLPIHIENGNGNVAPAQLRVSETRPGTNVRTLISLVCETCTPGFRLGRTLPSNNTWFFRMLQNGDFSMDDPLTTTKEAQFKSGGDLIIGGTLTQASSRDIKTNFTELNYIEILNKVNQLPIARWSYKKDQEKIQHIGPMAEDFHALFEVGLNNKGISSVDTGGIAFAAIKALDQKVSELGHIKSENQQLNRRINDLEAQVAELSDLKAQVAHLINKETDIKTNKIAY